MASILAYLYKKSRILLLGVYISDYIFLFHSCFALTCGSETVVTLLFVPTDKILVYIQILLVIVCIITFHF